MTDTAPEVLPARWVRDGDEWLVAVRPEAAREGARVTVARADGSHAREVAIVAVTAREHRGDRLCRVA